jgi:hypothetical protein
MKSSKVISGPLEESLRQFINSQNSQATRDRIKDLIESKLNEILIGDNGYDYINNIDYSIETNEFGSVDIKPFNFFTALLIKGFYAPSALYSDEYEIEYGFFTWDNGQLLFLEKTKDQIRDERIDKILNK